MTAWTVIVFSRPFTDYTGKFIKIFYGKYLIVLRSYQVMTTFFGLNSLGSVNLVGMTKFSILVYQSSKHRQRLQGLT